MLPPGPASARPAAGALAPATAEPLPDGSGAAPQRPSLRAAATMLVSCGFFTLMSLAIGEAHRAEPALSSTAASAVRSAVNLAVLLIMARGNVKFLLGDRRLALWLRGLAGATALLTYFAALGMVGVGEAAFLNNTSTFWVAALAPMLIGERARPLVWVAVLGSLVGTAALGLPREGHHDTLGRVLGAISGLAAAFAYLSVRKASASNPPQVIVFYFIAVSTLVCIVLALVQPVTWPAAASTWAWLVLAGLTATGGQLTMTRAYQLGPVAPIAALSTATPLFTALAGVLFLDEHPDRLAVFGMGLLAAFGVGLPLVEAAARGRAGKA